MASAWDVRGILEDVGTLERQLVAAAAHGPLRTDLAAHDGVQAAVRPLVVAGAGYFLEDGPENTPAVSTLATSTPRRPSSAAGDPTTPATPISSGNIHVAPPVPGGMRAVVNTGSSALLSVPNSPRSVGARSPSPTTSIAGPSLDQVERLAVVENAGQDTAWSFNYFLGAGTYRIHRTSVDAADGRARPSKNPHAMRACASLSRGCVWGSPFPLFPRRGPTAHHNYVGFDEDKNPYALSVMTDESADPAVHRAILWRKEVRQQHGLRARPVAGRW